MTNLEALKKLRPEIHSGNALLCYTKIRCRVRKMHCLCTLPFVAHRISGLVR